MEKHEPPWVAGHCDFCTWITGKLQSAGPAPVQSEPAAPCFYRGEDIPAERIATIGLDVRKGYLNCLKGLGFPAGTVCQCFCGPNCKSYVGT
jgi:hypothetical protein